jgi:hypothetical protein
MIATLALAKKSTHPVQSKTFVQRSSLISMTAAVFATGLLIAGCRSTPVVPSADNIKISRDDAKKSCQEIGKVQGSTGSSKGTVEQAIDDMKLDAARKGANYVRMEATSALGSSVMGTAYYCP